MDLKQLREERNEIVTSMEKFRDEIDAQLRDWTAEEEAKWTEFNEREGQLRRSIEREQQLLAAKTAELNDQDDDTEGRDDRPDRSRDQDQGGEKISRGRGFALALEAWATYRGNPEALSAEHRQACAQVGVNIQSREIDIPLHDTRTIQRLTRSCQGYRNRAAAERAFDRECERRDLSTARPGAGYVVPIGFINALERALVFVSNLRPISEVIRTATGQPLEYPTINDLSNKGERLAEGADIGASVDPTMGQVILNAYKYSSKKVLISWELAQDSAFNMDEVLGTTLGIRIARIQNEEFTTGTGTGQPEGVVTGATASGITSVIGGPDYDNIVDLAHTVDPAYRGGPSSGYMMNDKTLGHVRKIKDTQGMPIWQPSMRDDAPDTIFGWPYWINQDMADIGANAITMLFGDFTRYKIRDAGAIRLRRLEELAAQTDQIAFIAFLRSDARLVDAGAGAIKSMNTAAS